MKIIIIECPHCEGTGLYIGFTERDGAAVICYHCNGTGSTTYSYKEFTGRKNRNDVTRVFKKSQGYTLKGCGEITYDNGLRVEFDKVGVSYDEWKNGKTPKMIRGLGCPCSSDQSKCNSIKGFIDTCEELNGKYISMFSQCRLYKNCDSCWDRFEQSTKTEKGVRE